MNYFVYYGNLLNLNFSDISDLRQTNFNISKIQILETVRILNGLKIGIVVLLFV